MAASANDRKEKVKCTDNPFGCGGVVVIGDATFRMTSSCIPDMTGYKQYLARSRNQFSVGVINAENCNDAQTSCNDSHPTRCSHGPSFMVDKNLQLKGGNKK